MGDKTYLWFTRDPCGVVCMLLHPGALTPDSRSADIAVDTPHAQKGCAAKSRCARFGFLRVFGVLFCPLRLFKNFIGPWINNCVGFLNQKYFMLFLLYVNLMCCTAFIVLVCRVVTCVDSTADDGYEDSAGAARAFDWKASGPLRADEDYAPIPSRLAEYHPPPDAQLSPSAARRHWNAVRSMQLESATAPVPSFLQSSESLGPPRRLASAEDFVNGVLHAAQDPLSRWMQSRSSGDTGNDAQDDTNAFGAGTAHADGLPRQTPYDGVGYRRPRRHFLCDVALQSAVCGAMTFMFSFIFGLFTVVMFCDQLSSILSNTTGIESLKKVKNEKKSACQLLKEVFGGSFGCYWFLPVPITPYQQKRFIAELQRFPGAPDNSNGSEAAGGGGSSIASVRSAYDAEAASLPLAIRRGRSPHSFEEGNPEGGPPPPPLAQGATVKDIQLHQVAVPENEKDKLVSLEDTSHWISDESFSPNGFLSPILRQPRPLHVNNTADGFRGLNNTSHASVPAAAAPTAAAAVVAAESDAAAKEGEENETEDTSRCGAGNPFLAT
ncbi:hypothetical protein Emag_006678 [Eimeria magna]